jgi:hypothetical protein
LLDKVLSAINGKSAVLYLCVDGNGFGLFRRGMNDEQWVFIRSLTAEKME